MDPVVASSLIRWQEHIQILAEEIGPRGSTTEGERLGSEYCQKILENLGFATQVETFWSARSLYHPHLIAALIMLAAFAIYPLAHWISAVIAAILLLLVLVSEILELGLRDNLLRRLVPRETSQNVVATVPPTGDHHQDLLLIGHVDSHRTPLIFRSPRWITAYKVLITLLFLLSIVQLGLYTLGIVFQWFWIWPATFPAALAAVVLALMCIEADSTPFSPGAIDNATGAGLVLSLAEQLCSRPLQQTRVWLVCTGCEEVQHYGAADFFHRHESEFNQPVAVVLDSFGCAGPAWLTQEGIVVPFHASPNMVDLAQELAQTQPELGAYPTQISGGNTEMADALLAGVSAIAITGLTPDGTLPYWHQLGDTVDKLDPEILARTYAYVWELIKLLDQQA